MAERIVATFIGHPNDAYLEGLPARDLTADEVDALPDDLREKLLANAASEHAVFALHGRDLKAEAKEIGAASIDMSAPTPPITTGIHATDPAKADKAAAAPKRGA